MKNLLAVLLVSLVFTGCCFDAAVVVDNDDPEKENPFLNYNDKACEPLFEPDEL